MTEHEKKSVTIRVTFPFADIGAFAQLCRELRFENRFFLSEVPVKFVENLITYAKLFKVHQFLKGHCFYRARIHEFKMNKPHFSKTEMGPPPVHNATHGRLNPVGIPYLYLAKDINTAVSEVRPWIGCEMTVAEYALNRDISIINFSNKVFTNVPNDAKYDGAETTWRELITWVFSEPLDPRDDTAYLPTQYITERIKKEKFDGILYDSPLNADGYNLTLFDKDIASCGRSYKVKVNSINYVNNVSELETTIDANGS